MKLSIKYSLLFLLPLFILMSCNSYYKRILIEEKDKLYHEHLGLPKQVGIINDFEGIFSEKEIHSLDSIIINFSSIHSYDIVVITIDTIPGFKNLEEFTNNIDLYWSVGGKKKNGLIFALSKNQRTIRIRTDENTSRYLSNEYLKIVIDEQMTPLFKDEKYYDGMKIGLIMSIEKLK